jgi:hypothetical protein
MDARLIDGRPAGAQRGRSADLARYATVSAAVLVIASAFGVGAATSAGAATTPATASISPQTGQADVATNYVEAFTANAAFTNGTIRTVVPSGWTPPQTSNTAGNGYIVGAPGTCASVNPTPSLTGLSSGATQVTLAGVTCAKGDVVRLKYFQADPLKAGGSTFGPTSVQTSSSAGLVSITSPSVSETAGPTATFVLSAPSQSTPAGAKFSFTVTPEDAGGDVSTFGGTITFTSSDTGSSTVLPAPSAPGGTHTFVATLTTAGLQSITATDVKAARTITGTLSGITVDPATTSLLAWSAVAPVQTGPAGQIPVGSPLSFTLSAMDKYHNVTPAFAGRVAFSSGTDTAAVLPAAYTFVPGTDRGSHSFLLTPMTVGNQTYKATDTTETTIKGSTVVPVNLAVGPASTSGMTGTVGVPFSQTFTATGAEGAVTWTATDLPSGLSLNGATGALSGTPSTAGDFGPFTITATDSANPPHAGASSYTIDVGQDSQTVSFSSGPPATPYYGGPTYTPTGTSTSGLPVTFSADPSSSAVCTGTGSISFVGIGSCTVDANQAGNPYYSAAPQVQQSFSVGGAAQSIGFTSDAPTDAVVNGSTYTPIAAATSNLGVTLSVDASSGAVCSISGGVVSFTAIGTCTIDAVQGGNGDWLAAPELQQSFVVSGAPQAVSFGTTAPSDAVVGGATYAPAATAAPSGLPVTLTVDDLSTSVCAIDGDGNVSFSTVGVCIIDADQGGDNMTWAAATQVQQSFDVGPGTQTLSFTTSPPTGAEVGGTTYTPQATSTSASDLTAAPVTLSVDASSSSICTMASDGSVSFTAPGTCTVDADQTSSPNWSTAAQVQQSFTVSAAPPPYPQVTITSPTDDPTDPDNSTQIAVTPPDPGASNCPMQQFPDGGCTIDDLDGTVDQYFVASLPTTPGANVTYNWQVFYPPLFGIPGVLFQDAGITGSDSPVLHIAAGSLPQLVGDEKAGGDPYWRVELTTTVNGISTSVWFRFIYDSNFPLDFSTNCQIYSVFMGLDCEIVAPQLLPAVGFATTPPADAIVGGPTYTPIATINGSTTGYTLTIDPSAASVCSIDSNGTVSFIGTGTCTVDANQINRPTSIPPDPPNIPGEAQTPPEAQQSFQVGPG